MASYILCDSCIYFDGAMRDSRTLIKCTSKQVPGTYVATSRVRCDETQDAKDACVAYVEREEK